jgi:hypothetical protein
VGVTFWVPPVAASVYVLMSALSDITTCVALAAVTVNVDELPCVTEVGVAVIATLGATVVGVLDEAVLPLPQEDDIAINVAHRNKADHEYVGITLLIISHSFHPLKN